jgi:hypothetical protein
MRQFLNFTLPPTGGPACLARASHSGLMLAARITFPHFSVALGLRTVQSRSCASSRRRRLLRRVLKCSHDLDRYRNLVHGTLLRAISGAQPLFLRTSSPPAILQCRKSARKRYMDGGRQHQLMTQRVRGW